MHTVFIYGVFRTKTVKPIFTINRITRNWAMEGIEYFRHLWSIWNYFHIFIEKIVIATPIVWVVTQEWLNRFKELFAVAMITFAFVLEISVYRQFRQFHNIIAAAHVVSSGSGVPLILCLLRHMFLSWIALRNCPFIYGTWYARRYRCFSGAWISMTEDSKCCWAHAISSTSSKISHTWKGTLLGSLLKSSWSKCFMDLYVIRRLLD